MTVNTKQAGRAPSVSATIERFLDIMVFEKALITFQSLEGDSGKATLTSGENLGRRYLASTLDGIDKYIQPVLSAPSGSMLKDEYARATREGLSYMEGLEARVDLYDGAIRLLNTNASLKKDTLKGGRTDKTFRALAKALIESKTKEELLKALVLVPSISGVTAFRQWIKEACSQLGIAVDVVDEVMADSETIVSVGEALNKLDQQTLAVPPGSDEAKVIAQERSDILDELKASVAATPHPEASLAAVAATVASKPQLPDFIEAGRFNDEQLAVIFAEGKLLVNAGAGSGKSTSLAAKVAYHVKEKGIDPNRILVTSFTVAASKEIKAKIQEKYGIEGSYIGSTINSIGLRLLLENWPQARVRQGNTNNCNALLEIAWRQIQRPRMAGAKVPWGQISQQKSQEKKDNFAKNQLAWDLLNKLISLPRLQYYPRTISMLESFASQIDAGKDLSPRQKEVLNDILAKNKFTQRVTKLELSALADRAIQATNKYYASISDEEDTTPLTEGSTELETSGSAVSTEENLAVSGDKVNKASLSPYYDQVALGTDFPEISWVHLGKDFFTEKKINKRQAVSSMERWRTNLQSPGECASKASYDIAIAGACLFQAYETLKSEDKVLGPAMDVDDQIILAAKLLKNNPELAEKVANQFDLVLIDEAQDCNAVQNEMFRLLSSQAKTTAYIGDDRQAIYGFRGARPDEFVGLKDKGFNVLNMVTNYRSGSAIVEAGERLIAHNGDRQLPKTCRAYQGRGLGGIMMDTPVTHDAAALQAATEIAAGVKAGDRPSDFGVVTRTNAEKSAYMMSLLAEGIPFRTNRGGDIFSNDAMKCVIAWLAVAISNSRDELNESLARALDTKLPSFGLGLAFFEKVRAACGPKDYVTYLIENGVQDLKLDKRYLPRAEELVSALIKLRKGTFSSTSSLLIHIMYELKGSDGRSAVDILASRVNIDELISKNNVTTKTVPRELIEAEATAPVDPLFHLAEGNMANNTNPHAFLDVVNRLRNIAKAKEGEEADAVLVDTCHQWKGLEAKTVFVCMAGGVWPSAFGSGQDDAGEAPVSKKEQALDEDRRLAYVAITRGRDRVVVQCPQTNYLERPAKPSQFVEEACIPTMASAQSNKQAFSKMSSKDRVLHGKYLVASKLVARAYKV